MKRNVDRKKQKRRIIYTLFSSVILLGVLLLLAPIIFDMVNLAHRKDMMTKYEQQLPVEDAQLTLIKKYNEMIYH
ncbi:hypothetical protein, partial [Enterococcus lactis]